MAVQDKVFSPAFGNRPTRLVGREDLLEILLAGLGERPGSKGRATVLPGQRGMGKTVLLLELADRAREQGFAVANPTAVREGMIERIVEKLGEDSDRFLRQGKRKVTGAVLALWGFRQGFPFPNRKVQG